LKISEVIDQFATNLRKTVQLDTMVGFTEEERTIHVQAAFLRAAAQLFDRDEKADFARTAKIAWDAVHK
jgi:hypothetical protein